MDLPKPKWYDTYDKPAMEAAMVKHPLIASLEHENHSYLPVLEKERFGSFVQQLNNVKAADAYGIAAEHIKYASNDEATVVLFLIINGILKFQEDTQHNEACPSHPSAKERQGPYQSRQL